MPLLMESNPHFGRPNCSPHLCGWKQIGINVFVMCSSRLEVGDASFLSCVVARGSFLGGALIFPRAVLHVLMPTDSNPSNANDFVADLHSSFHSYGSSHQSQKSEREEHSWLIIFYPRYLKTLRFAARYPWLQSLHPSSLLLAFLSRHHRCSQQQKQKA